MFKIAIITRPVLNQLYVHGLKKVYEIMLGEFFTLKRVKNIRLIVVVVIICSVFNIKYLYAHY